MTVDDFAEVLRNPAVQVTGQDWYHNQQGQRGYKATLSLGSDQYWYSVSNTDIAITPGQVAAAILSPSRVVRRENPYDNSSGEPGFEATVWSEGHSYMLGAGNIKIPS